MATIFKFNEDSKAANLRSSMSTKSPEATAARHRLKQ